MSKPRDPDFDWRIRIRGMTEDDVAEVIEKLEAKLADAERERDEARAAFTNEAREAIEARAEWKAADARCHELDAAVDRAEQDAARLAEALRDHVQLQAARGWNVDKGAAALAQHEERVRSGGAK